MQEIKKKYPEIYFVLNGGIDSLEKARLMANIHDGVMIGRLIQNNPFILRYVDSIFFDEKNNLKIDENIIVEYFNYIRPKLNKDSIFRLLSPILQVFFGVPKSKSYKLKIHENLKNQNIDYIENLLINFIKNKELVVN